MFGAPIAQAFEVPGQVGMTGEAERFGPAVRLTGCWRRRRLAPRALRQMVWLAKVAAAAGAEQEENKGTERRASFHAKPPNGIRRPAGGRSGEELARKAQLRGGLKGRARSASWQGMGAERERGSRSKSGREGGPSARVVQWPAQGCPLQSGQSSQGVRGAESPETSSAWLVGQRWPAVACPSSIWMACSQEGLNLEQQSSRLKVGWERCQPKARMRGKPGRLHGRAHAGMLALGRSTLQPCLRRLLRKPGQSGMRQWA